MIHKRTNSHIVVESVFSRFFKAFATVRTTGHVCQACFVIQTKKGQCVPFKPPGERKLLRLQEARTCCTNPMRANFHYQPSEPIHEPTTRSRYIPFETDKGHQTHKDCERIYDIREQMVLCLSLRQPSALWVWLKARKDLACISPSYRVLRQGSIQICQLFSELVFF